MEEVILLPPAPPISSSTSPLRFKRMVGAIDESGALAGAMKFAGEAAKPYEFTWPGREKSSMPSFNMMPVDLDTMREPKLEN